MKHWKAETVAVLHSTDVNWKIESIATLVFECCLKYIYT